MVQGLGFGQGPLGGSGLRVWAGKCPRLREVGVGAVRCGAGVGAGSGSGCGALAEADVE